MRQGTPLENILKVMVHGADRYRFYYNDLKNRARIYENHYDDLVGMSGQVVTVEVDHMRHRSSGCHTLGTSTTCL
ncbi:hypothetical protein SP19_170 [Salmonella phage 19]|nr:hypothetical protein SP19_170 [Salmonella phage 19]